MTRALRFGGLFFFSPARAAEESRKPGAVARGAVLYVLTLAAAALFQALKPFDFPDASAPLPGATQGLGFWAGVMAWQPLLMAALVLFLGALRRWMRDGWLPLKVASSALWTAIPIILAIAYARLGLPRAAFAALFLLWAAPVALSAASVPREEWTQLLAFMLGLNVIELASFLPQAAVTLARSEEGYKAVVAGAGVWMLLSGAFGLRRLPPERPLPRALLPLLFALVLQIAVVVLCYLLGALPKETLKALLYG